MILHSHSANRMSVFARPNEIRGFFDGFARLFCFASLRRDEGVLKAAILIVT